MDVTMEEGQRMVRELFESISAVLNEKSGMGAEAGLAAVQQAVYQLVEYRNTLNSLVVNNANPITANSDFHLTANTLISRLSYQITRLNEIAAHLKLALQKQQQQQQQQQYQPPASPMQVVTPAKDQARQQQGAGRVPPPAGMSSAEVQSLFLDAPPEISPAEIQLEGLIGQGAFARVYRGRCRGLAVAVKVPTKQTWSAEEIKAFQHEVSIMRKVSHPNVVQLLGVCLQPGNLMIITELMKGDIDKISKSMKLNIIQKLQMAYDAALGMNWLSGIAGILHRDLKPENLLVEVDSLRVRVADFGLSEMLREGAKKRDQSGPKGTALFAAPEVLRQEEFDSSSDVYSFSIILWQLATGKEPFDNYSEIEPFYQAVCFNHERPPLTNVSPPGLAQLIKRCWDPVPGRRPKWSEIVNALEALTINAAVGEDATPDREFWKKFFVNPLKMSVQWRSLEEVLIARYNINQVQLTKVKEMLLPTPGVDLVTIERFHQVYLWFGNWIEDSKVLRELNVVTTANWFHNEISVDEATSRLQHREDGTFLIRLSTSVRACPFSISVTNAAAPNGVLHFRVHRKETDVTPSSSQPMMVTGAPATATGKFAVELANNRGWKTAEHLSELIEILRAANILKDACPKNKVNATYSMI